MDSIQRRHSQGPPAPINQAERIVNAALEVFSQQSFDDARTDEIARRAHVSKRDIYAHFPDKHALLTAAIQMVIEADDQNFSSVISHTSNTDLKDRLEIVGLALVNEVLSPTTIFVSRVISSESLREPRLGKLYVDKWYTRRCAAIAVLLDQYVSRGKKRMDRNWQPSLAASEYSALVLHFPQLTAMVGMRSMWTAKRAQAHVEEAVSCFLKAHRLLE